MKATNGSCYLVSLLKMVGDAIASVGTSRPALRAWFETPRSYDTAYGLMSMDGYGGQRHESRRRARAPERLDAAGRGSDGRLMSLVGKASGGGAPKSLEALYSRIAGSLRGILAAIIAIDLAFILLFLAMVFLDVNNASRAWSGLFRARLDMLERVAAGAIPSGSLPLVHRLAIARDGTVTKAPNVSLNRNKAQPQRILRKDPRLGSGAYHRDLLSRPRRRRPTRPFRQGRGGIPRSPLFRAAGFFPFGRLHETGHREARESCDIRSTRGRSATSTGPALSASREGAYSHPSGNPCPP